MKKYTVISKVQYEADGIIEWCDTALEANNIKEALENVTDSLTKQAFYSFEIISIQIK